jgi:hypothetical protein
MSLTVVVCSSIPLISFPSIYATRTSFPKKERGSRETSPLETEIGDPGYYSADPVYFSGLSLTFLQED